MSDWPTTDTEWHRHLEREVRETKCRVCAELRAELVNARAVALEMFKRWKTLRDGQ